MLFVVHIPVNLNSAWLLRKVRWISFHGNHDPISSVFYIHTLQVLYNAVLLWNRICISSAWPCHYTIHPMRVYRSLELRSGHIKLYFFSPSIQFFFGFSGSLLQVLRDILGFPKISLNTCQICIIVGIYVRTVHMSKNILSFLSAQCMHPI